MNKKYYFNNVKMQRISYFYFAVFLIMTILFFVTFIIFLIIISICVLFLGIYFKNKSKKVTVFEISDNKIFYHPKKNHGILKHNDFYNLFINNKFNEMEILSIKNIEKSNSFLKGNNLYLTNQNDKKIELLLDDNKIQINEIYNDLKKLINISNKELERIEKNSHKDTIHIEKEDYQKTITIEKTGNKTYTKTRTTYSNKPNTKNNLLIIETITAIVSIMKRLEKTLEIEDVIKRIMTENDLDYDSLSNTINFINKNTIDDCKTYIIEKFGKCKNEHTKNTIDYIIKTSLSPTKNQFFLNRDIENLIKELLISADYGELGLDHTIAQLRT